MKNLIVLLIALMSCSQTQVMGQILKLGYIDQQFVYDNFPEYQLLRKEIEGSSAKYQEVLKEKYAQYQQKLDAYQKLPKGQVAPLILKDKETELVNLQQSIQEFQSNSEKDLQLTYQKKFAVIEEKVKGVIADYGQENKYAYIFRSDLRAEDSWPIVLFAGAQAVDISKEILLKLGVTAATAPPIKAGLLKMIKK
ncbi:OmpH family outer membrane protein [Runella sp. MFBS21]|uniref:OmpH family outer membrane protein n=1 Tax=Runella sp. MFBS21 TaxID=3034018 RepID=UPI0023F818AA|nr:OmpH family outer membrane protein [Runella sp. MFBS21]MDF7819300.1 OmpH family outer membrane protein [Runella sp. MFBS21]